MPIPVRCTLRKQDTRTYFLTYGELKDGIRKQDTRLIPQNDGGSIVLRFSCSNLYNASSPLPQAIWSGFQPGGPSLDGLYCTYKLTWTKKSAQMPDLEPFFSGK